MKDQNKLIIGIVVIITVAYFLFFKKKEGFTVQETKEIIPNELLTYVDVILPQQYDNNKRHPVVIKAQELVASYFKKNNISFEKVATGYETNRRILENKYRVVLENLEMKQRKEEEEAAAKERAQAAAKERAQAAAKERAYKAACVFDPRKYADAYPDLKNAFGYDEDKLKKHYYEYGIRENRSPCGKMEMAKEVKAEFQPMEFDLQDTCLEECKPMLMSKSKQFIARLLPDGNLQVQSEKGIIWQSNSGNRGTAPYRWFMQGDGNVVIYDSTKRPIWASNTGGRQKGGPYKLVMQDDYNLVAYGATGPIWATR
jgi:hypothetical protein